MLMPSVIIGGIMYLSKPYDDALLNILTNGSPKTNLRTNQKTLSLFGLETRYSLDRDNFFPILTGRKMFYKSIFTELLWFISGSTSNDQLVVKGANFWTSWVKDIEGVKRGYLGPIYGYQLRNFGGEYGDGSNSRGGFDQLAYMMKLIETDPTNRGILFSLWNPNDLDKSALRPCHYSFQISIDDNGNLSSKLTQRSADYPVGVPANIQFYSALTLMIAQQTGYKAREFIHSAGDAHIYENQIPAVKEYLSREKFVSPKLTINKAPSIYTYVRNDFNVYDYYHQPTISIPVAV